jgi:hypothetical protein
VRLIDVQAHRIHSAELSTQHCLARCLAEWIAKYNRVGYLSECERAIADRRRVFCGWDSSARGRTPARAGLPRRENEMDKSSLRRNNDEESAPQT